MSQQMELEAGAEAKATDDRGLVPGPEPAQAPAESKDTVPKKRKPRQSEADRLASNDTPHQRWGGSYSATASFEGAGERPAQRAKSVEQHEGPPSLPPVGILAAPTGVASPVAVRPTPRVAFAAPPVSMRPLPLGAFAAGPVSLRPPPREASFAARQPGALAVQGIISVAAKPHMQGRQHWRVKATGETVPASTRVKLQTVQVRERGDDGELFLVSKELPVKQVEWKYLMSPVTMFVAPGEITGLLVVALHDSMVDLTDAQDLTVESEVKLDFWDATRHNWLVKHFGTHHGDGLELSADLCRKWHTGTMPPSLASHNKKGARTPNTHDCALF